mgnify:CR=1 FL=1
MKTVTEAGAKYTKKSFMAFLEGQPTCDEKWVLGVVRASVPKDVLDALKSLSTYGNRDRFEFLRRACGVA